MSLRRNIIANYLGQGWAAVMALAFVPLYIRQLGMEAYGLIGLFAVMQAWLTLLDMGMTPTLAREMARFTAGAHSVQSIRNLLRSVEIVCFGLAIAICLVVWASAGWLASDWLKAEKLPTGVVKDAIAVMALVVALRFVEGIYRSALFGLQRQVWCNAVNAAVATLRSVGAAIVLTTLSPTIEAFFMWQTLVSLISVFLFACGVHRTLPRSPVPASFSAEAVNRVWHFAGGMMGITFLAILLTQVDKVLLSRLLSLEGFGYYSLATTIASVLYLVITPITTALYPRLVEMVAQADSSLLSATYHKGAQLVTTLTAPAALLLTFFGEGVMFTWTGNADLAHSAGTILSALTLGNFLNGMMYMPYQLQLAHGWTSLTLKINTVSVLLLVPAIFWIVPRYGALGAAGIWITLNAACILASIQLMHLRILPADKWQWYLNDVGLPTLGVAVTMLLVYNLKPSTFHDRGSWFIFLTASLICALVVSIILAKDIRSRIYVSVREARGAKFSHN